MAPQSVARSLSVIIVLGDYAPGRAKRGHSGHDAVDECEHVRLEQSGRTLPSPSLHSPSEHKLWSTFPALEASRPFPANSRGFLSDQLCPMDWTNTVVPSSSSARWRCIRRTCRRTLTLAC